MPPAWGVTLIGFVVLVFAALGSLSVGLVTLTPHQVFTALFQPQTAPLSEVAVIWTIRLPRIVVAAIVGAALAAVGVVMQAILRNPLAEPGITGVSSGAAVGAIAGITLGIGSSHAWGLPLTAFLGAALVALLLQSLLQFRKDLGPATIILVGVSISALCGALIHLLIANAPDDALARSALFWLAGDLELRNWHHVVIVLVPVLAGLAILGSRFRSLDALALGEQIAATSGVHVTRERIVLLLIASLVTGAAVAVSGVISFVGLVVPHAVRLIIGASHGKLLLVSTFGGAIFLVIVDTIARSAFGSVVVQTGVVAALVGAPVFLALLIRRTA